jgi:hypothetical protein
LHVKRNVQLHTAVPGQVVPSVCLGGSAQATSVSTRHEGSRSSSDYLCLNRVVGTTELNNGIPKYVPLWQNYCTYSVVTRYSEMSRTSVL